MWMKKIRFILAGIFFSIISAVHALEQQQQEIKLIARIKSMGNKVELVKDQKSAPIMTELAKPELKKIIDSLETGDEALIEGHLRYRPKGIETETMPAVFVISSIRPISLKRLGHMEGKFIEEPKELMLTDKAPFAPKSIPVSGELIGAITFTASLLMLQDLTSSQASSNPQHQLNSGLIFSAGSLATGLLIYEQISGKKKTRK
jgi:hypothetical protein